ncbi:MAG: FAD-dependent oxidoreductase [Coriobacteriia bacterium]|nr:FAD-dependent oxidoreductase [Coriobacteriia bacterium]MCL2750366.1 FAD-dependent oxidoreductase [Coriobacteriia bacterium]
MEKTTITLQMDKSAVSLIDGYNCVNCGKCEDFCPVAAIEERQKEVCHLCPDCTERKALTVQQVYDLRLESCTLECPLGISPQGYIGLTKADKLKEAYNLVAEKNPLPTICGYICHRPCEKVCKRGTLVDEPLQIRALKRYLGETFIDLPLTPYPEIHDLHIAIIGAGPAGLTAAHGLAQKGYKVTVFDQAGEAGGMLIRGIPDFRLDKELACLEILKLEEAGVNFEFGYKVSPSNIEGMLKKYDKIIVATGAQVPKTLPIEGWRGQNRFFAMNLMEKVNAGFGVKLSGSVVIIGGGSVAMDTARAALRLGAEQVTVICLESGEDIPAHNWEIEEAKEEGVALIEGVSPLRFLGDVSKLEGVEYAEIKNLDLKTLKFDLVAGSESKLAADYVIVATGQRSDHEWKDVKGVIFAGDILGGECSVIDAMASGRAAAIAIDNELMGRDYLDFEVDREIGLGERKYKVYPAKKLELQFEGLNTIDPASRIESFEVVEIGLDDDEAILETERCLGCGYRYVDAETCLGCGVCLKVCPKGDVVSMVAVPKQGKEGS